MAPRNYPAPVEDGFSDADLQPQFENAIEGRETTMAWTTPTLVEICVGLEINGYLPPEELPPED
jgi:coenzyme PQQ precursor peptide PqqA